MSLLILGKMDCFNFSAWLSKAVTFIIIIVFTGPTTQSSFKKYSFNVLEEMPAKTYVGSVAETSGNHFYEIIGDNGKNEFKLGNKTGRIETRVTFNREKLKDSSILFWVRIDNSIFAQVVVTIVDVNDCRPTFPNTVSRLSIPETTTQVGTKRSIDVATDCDAGNNSVISYSIISGNTDGFFALVDATDTLSLVVISVLDRETTSEVRLNISACDYGSPMLCGFTTLIITLIDVNDNSPLFNPSRYIANVTEGTDLGTVVTTVHATDIDEGRNAEITYEIDRTSDPNRLFSVKSKSGVIVTSGELDYEKAKTYNIRVIARDNGISPRQGICFVTIHILDKNDNAPVITVVFFTTGSYQVIENLKKEVNVAKVSVTDKDAGENANVTVTIGPTSGYFELRLLSNPGFVIVAKRTIDRERTPQFKFDVIAQDHGNPPLRTTQQVVINVGDENDSAPEFLGTPYVVSVNESAKVGQSVFKVITRDQDLGKNGKVTLTRLLDGGPFSSWFDIEPSSGVLKVVQSLDREKKDTIFLTIKAKDHGTPELSSSITVRVQLEDANDNPPVFEKSTYTFSVPEHSTKDVFVGKVKAIDKDLSEFARVTYRLEVNSDFVIDSKKGKITTKRTFDREINSSYTFDVIAQDGGSLEGKAKVVVTILDINDQKPHFERTFYNFSVHENTPVNFAVGFVKAIDKDIGENARVEYTLTKPESTGTFIVNKNTGGIIPTRSLNYRLHQVYQFYVSASDSQGLKAPNSAMVVVSVLQAKYTAPYFDRPVYNFSSEENKIRGSRVGKVIAKRDNFGIGFITFVILSGNNNGYFAIDSSGIITNVKEIDFETENYFRLRVQVKDKYDESLNDTAAVNIGIIDVNDNAPQFGSLSKTIKIKEGVSIGHLIYTANATDLDSGKNGEIGYNILDIGVPFKIDKKTGQVVTTENIDFESIRKYSLKIRATDSGIPTLNSTLLLNIELVDVNDNPPSFGKKSFTVVVNENVNIGYKLLQLNVTDADSGLNGEVALFIKKNRNSDAFKLVGNGWLVTAKPLDRETVNAYQLQIIARDRGSPSKTSRVTVYVGIGDINDCSPVFTKTSYAFSVREEQPPGASVGQVVATDKDSGLRGYVTYSFSKPTSEFSIEERTGILRTRIRLDREKQSTAVYNLVVNAADGGTPSKKTVVNVKVFLHDINDNKPKFDQDLPYTVSIPDSSPVGYSVLKVRAHDNDLGEAGKVIYSLRALFPEEQESVVRFKIDPTTGIITTRTGFTSLKGKMHSYSFTVLARDAGKPILQSSHKVFVFIFPNFQSPHLFPRRAEHLILPESTVVNSSIITVRAKSGGNTVVYSIVDGNAGSTFSVNRKTGNVKLKLGLRYETRRTFMLKVMAEDSAGKRDNVLINIVVLDTNLNWPVFTENPIIQALREHPGNSYDIKRFFTANVTDPDYRENGMVMYSIELQGPGSPIFEIDAFTGQMYATGIIDREKTPEWTLVLTATDLALNISNRHTSTATMKIIVIDRNDNPPRFTSRNSSYMMEDESVGYPVMRVVATDPDEGNNAVVRYNISSGNAGGHFAIDRNSGEITLNKTVAHRLKSKYNLVIKATDMGQPSLSTVMPLEIAIIDVNNDRPKFSKPKYNGMTPENGPVGATVMQILANDSDTGLNGKIKYSMQENEHFTVNADTGIITTLKVLDREKWDRHTLSVSAQDSSYPFYSDYASVVIQVKDENDCVPHFLARGNISVGIPENSGPIVVYTFVASDCDIGKNADIAYRIVRGDKRKFAINKKSGKLSTVTSLDREAKDEYELQIEAVNVEAPFGKAVQDIKVRVLDVNDENPAFRKDQYVKNVPENLPVNSTILTVLATDKDLGANGRIVYSIPGNDTKGVRGKFDINSISGEIVLISALDYEDSSQRTYYFQVQASDQATHGARHSRVQVVIRVTDVNDNTPIFTRPVYERLSNGKVGAFVVKVEANDLDSGPKVRYSFEQVGSYFTIDEQSGIIKVGKQIPPGLYKLRVKATDFGKPQKHTFAVVVVNVGQFRPGIPIFLNKSVAVNIRENLPRGSVVCTLKAQTSSFDRIQYSLVSDSNPGNAFKIGEYSGVIKVNNPSELDYERRQKFLLGVLASVATNKTLSSYTMVQILLTDENDNTPVISPSNLDVSLPETTGPANVNLYVLQFTATDSDSGINGKITFDIISGNETGDFFVHPEDGVLVLLKRLDYERKKSYRLKVRARDHGSNPRSAVSVITINVENKNDNPPTFLKYSPAFISELTQVGQYVYVVQAKDLDDDSTITYGLSKEGEGTDTFNIDPNQGTMQLVRRLDYETKSSYRLVITATDGVYKTNTTLVINVTDENDNRPKFVEPGYYVYLPESIPKGHMVIRVNATDKDSGDYGKVRYSLGNVPLDAFVIDQKTGNIWTTRAFKLDPSQPPLELTVVASDGGTPALVGTTSVRLRVRDPNYKGPRFLYLSYKAVLSEDVSLGSEVVTVRAQSSVPDMYIRYQILSGNTGKKFDIDSRLGRIYVSSKLDRETQNSYKLIIEARDSEKSPRTSETSVNIDISDANDNSPQFPAVGYTIKVYENISRNTELLDVNATDADDPMTGNGRITYRISSGNTYNWFQIDPRTGLIKVARILDRETLPLHRLTVTAEDGGTPSLSTVISVVVKLLDVNDNIPEFRMDSPNINDLEVRENQPGGTLAFKVKAEDHDEGSNSLLAYSIIGGDGLGFFTIDNETGWIYTKRPLDYEKKNLYKLLIQAVDHGNPPLNGSFEYRVAVRDVNEFIPYFMKTSYSFPVRGDSKIGSIIGKVQAHDKDGGDAGKIYYSFVNPASDALKITRETGEIIVNTDLRKRIEKRKRRSTENDLLVYVIRADNGPNTTAQDVPLTVSVDYKCPGCTYLSQSQTDDGKMKGLPLVLVIVFAAVTSILLLGIIIFLFTAWKRRQHQYDDNTTKVDTDEVDNAEGFTSEDQLRPMSPEREPLQHTVEKYPHGVFISEKSAATSSGRGSSESQLLEDHPFPSVAVTDNGSTHSFVVYQEKPILDSGIQQDFDHLSDVTISDIMPEKEMYQFVRKSKKGLSSGESHESLKDFKDEGGGEAAGGMDVGNLLYAKLAEVDADEQEAIMDGTRPFQEEGAPSHGGSLSTIVGSEEELRGSYNWDYLLDWGPQFQPLAAVFSEIAKMKDANGDLTSSRKASDLSQGKIVNGTGPSIVSSKIASPNLRVRDTASTGRVVGPNTQLMLTNSQPSYPAIKDIVFNGSAKNSSCHDKCDPILTIPVEDVMPMNYKADVTMEQLQHIPSNIPSNFISNRTSLLSSVTSLPRSPLSVQSSYTPGPLSPNFTPVITPLVTRSPSVSPLGTPDYHISPARSNAASVLDIADSGRQRDKDEATTISQETPVTLSDLTSEIEIEV